MKIETLLTNSAHVKTMCAIISVTLFGFTAARSAVIVQLDGGDPGEGYSPLANVIAVESFGQPNPNLPVQGVGFNTNADSINITSITGSLFGGFGFPSETTANDVNLGDAIGGIIFNSVSLSIEITGLNVGQTYQIDSFFALLGGSTRYFSIDTVGSTTSVGTGTLTSPFLAYILTESMMPDSLGNINITYSAFTDSSETITDFPVLNAVSVTSAIPEPSIIGFLFVGASAFLARRKSVNCFNI